MSAKSDSNEIISTNWFVKLYPVYHHPYILYKRFTREGEKEREKRKHVLWIRVEATRRLRIKCKITQILFASRSADDSIDYLRVDEHPHLFAGELYGVKGGQAGGKDNREQLSDSSFTMSKRLRRRKDEWKRKRANEWVDCCARIVILGHNNPRNIGTQ